MLGASEPGFALGVVLIAGDSAALTPAGSRCAAERIHPVINEKSQWEILTCCCQVVQW
jgi:hypothetical protein